MSSRCSICYSVDSCCAYTFDEQSEKINNLKQENERLKEEKKDLVAANKLLETLVDEQQEMISETREKINKLFEAIEIHTEMPHNKTCKCGVCEAMKEIGNRRKHTVGENNANN